MFLSATHTQCLLWAGQNDLPPTPDTLHLGCSYQLHSSHNFLSTLGACGYAKNNNIKNKTKQKQSKQVTKSFQLKTSTCRDETLKKPTKQDRNNTTTLLHPSLYLV